jgi:hypothetical protein
MIKEEKKRQREKTIKRWSRLNDLGWGWENETKRHINADKEVIWPHSIARQWEKETNATLVKYTYNGSPNGRGRGREKETKRKDNKMVKTA